MRGVDVTFGKAGVKIPLYRAGYRNRQRIGGSPKSPTNPVGEHFEGGVGLTGWMYDRVGWMALLRFTELMSRDDSRLRGVNHSISIVQFIK